MQLRIFLFILIFAVFSFESVFASNELTKKSFSWLNLGLGGIGIESAGGAALGFSVVVDYTKRYSDYAYSFRSIGGAALFKPDEVSEFSFLINKIFEYENVGLLFKGNKEIISFGLGASIITGIKRGRYIGPANLDNATMASDYESTPFATFGLPIEVKLLLLTAVYDFGLDVIGFGNINPVQSFWGLCLCLRVGKGL
ncbi:MAG: hypothetical protein FD145_1032 [Candidatus Saganbacteria bacterium]|uniref:Outer membrane protein beta-barrel domain-containing protein n=1 Tax=Candidatus Saganbacteria bacterium TaxID=2575572 RepID=A0A833L369_UNCSA|nr:MAG: hypothetical protein FD145_1032 [Candidatus Saganbacteria bacterium]